MKAAQTLISTAIAASLLASVAVASSASSPTGERHLVAAQPDGAVRDAQGRAELRVTIWYPTTASAPLTSIDVGPPGQPYFQLGEVAMDGPFALNTPHPTILLSHGFGGSARTMAWFGKAMTARGYMVIAVDHPGNNGIDPMTVPGAVLWGERARDLSTALAAVLADPTFADRIDTERIGVAGFSIGGLTALVAGGARVSPENIVAFCASHPGDGVCQPQVEFPLSLDDWTTALESEALAPHVAEARDDHSLPGVRAVFAMAPVVQVADPASLAAMSVPVSIVTGAADVTVPPETHARVAQSLLPDVALEVIPQATHYSFLAECTAEGRRVVPVCADAAAQGEAHQRAVAAAEALFEAAFADAGQEHSH